MPQYPDIHFKRPKRKVVIGATVITLVLAWYLASRSPAIRPVASASAVMHGTYTTNFPLTENPISEGGNWINGQAAGIDWADIRTTPGFAFGTESGKVRYGDSTALLTGTWGPNQTVQATVHTVNQNDKIYEEVELRLRSSLSPHRLTGYEVNFRCSKTPDAYTQIVRWNGRLGDFTILKTAQGSQFGVADRDVVKATIVGNVITSYINGVQVLQTRDNSYGSGSPGMGFYLERTTGVNSDFGFTRFTATDGPPADLQALAGGRGAAWPSAGLLPGLLSRSQALLFSR
jgi:hypothetical protein